MHNYTLPPQWVLPRVAIVRSVAGDYRTLSNLPAADDTDPPELHVTHVNTLTPSISLPADHSFLDPGAASRLAWEVMYGWRR